MKIKTEYEKRVDEAHENWDDALYNYDMATQTIECGEDFDGTADQIQWDALQTMLCILDEFRYEQFYREEEFKTTYIYWKLEKEKGNK